MFILKQCCQISAMADWVAEFDNRHDQFVKDGGAMALSGGDVV
jgi:hypothetical protein